MNDRTVDAAIASGASSVAEITARCAAGGRCGGCWPELQRLLDVHESTVAVRSHHAAA